MGEVVKGIISENKERKKERKKARKKESKKERLQTFHPLGCGPIYEVIMFHLVSVDKIMGMKLHVGP